MFLMDIDISYGNLVYILLVAVASITFLVVASWIPDDAIEDEDGHNHYL